MRTMPASDVRLLEPDEFREAMELAELCFGRAPGNLERRMPHCFDEEHPERHAVVEVGGELVSHVVCVPATLRAGPARIDCVGIAGVATHPDHRGNGHMSALLEFWLERLDDRAIPIAELEGDRRRYGRFGWENAGREHRYRITERSFDGAGGDPEAVRPLEGTDLDSLMAVHETERYGVARDRRRYGQLLGQAGLETVVTEDGAFSYLSYRGNDLASVLEFGGTPSGIRDLVAATLERASKLEVYTHPRHPLDPVFRSVATDWSTIPHRKLNILDLAGLLAAYQPFLTERWARFRPVLDPTDSTVSLGIDGGQAVTLRFGETVTVERTDGTPDISLDRRRMVDFLFGSPHRYWPIDDSFPELEVVLPLEYYFWETETI